MFAMKRRLAIQLSAAALLLAVAQPALSQEEKVSIRLDWTVLGYHTPFYLAAARGYYKDAKLAVEIVEGRGSTNTIQLVGAGSNTFGFADGTAVAKSIGLGVPIKMVMGILQRSPMGVIVPAESSIKTGTDLKGKRIGSCPGSPPGMLVPAFLTAIGLQPTDVTIVSTQCGAPAYLVVPQKQADGVAGYTAASRGALARLGFNEIRSFEFAEVGINVPAHGIIASTETLAKQPDMVRRFLAATAKGWIEAQRDPAAAVAATVAAMPLLAGKEDSMKAELEENFKYLDTTRTKGKSFGWQSVDDWKAAEDVLVKYMEVKQQPSAEAYFTNQYIPQ
jgi:NitT/TauT family transport system substrate-binding protein